MQRRSVEKKSITPVKRSYDAAVLNACGALLYKKPHQEKILHVVFSRNLEHVSMIDGKGQEINVLSHKSQLEDI